MGGGGGGCVQDFLKSFPEKEKGGLVDKNCTLCELQKITLANTDTGTLVCACILANMLCG